MITTERDDCHLCGTECNFKIETRLGKRTETIECSQCGQFMLTDKFCEMVMESRLQNVASKTNRIEDFHYKQFVIYLRQAMWMDCVKRFQLELIRKPFSEYPAIVTESILGDSLRHFRYLNLSDQLDNAIIALANKAEGLFSGYTVAPHGFANLDKMVSRLVGIDIRNTSGRLYNIGFSPEGSALIKQLYENGYITKNQENPTSVVQLGLTLKGWQRYNELQRGSLVSNTAFMAMEFAYSEWAYNSLFRPAVEVCGFKLETVEEKPNHGSIPDDIELKIKRAPFVIVDISHGSNGAYWEGGFATALGKPVIYTCDEATWEFKDSDDPAHKPLKPHFDIAHRQTVIWKKDDIETELNKEATKKIKAMIRNNIPNAKLDD